MNSTFASQTTVPSGSIAAAAFTTEQQQYLQGFFAGVAQRGAVPFVGHTASGQITSDPVSGLANRAGAIADLEEETYGGTPCSERGKEERWKHEEHALDVWDKLVAHAN